MQLRAATLGSTFSGVGVSQRIKCSRGSQEVTWGDDRGCRQAHTRSACPLAQPTRTCRFNAPCTHMEATSCAACPCLPTPCDTWSFSVLFTLVTCFPTPRRAGAARRLLRGPLPLLLPLPAGALVARGGAGGARLGLLRRLPAGCLHAAHGGTHTAADAGGAIRGHGGWRKLLGSGQFVYTLAFHTLVTTQG